MNERNVLLDVLKGFAIVLVVLGHSIQYSDIDFDSNPVFRVIYSFHMPLFMFVSGFVSFKNFDGSIKKLVKRFKSLIIPFWAWFVFASFFSYLLFIFKGGPAPDFVKSLILVLKYPDNGGLWFLWVLFLNYVVLFLSLKISSRKEEVFMVLFFIFIIVFVHFSGFNYLGISLLRWHLPFYLFGYVTSKHIGKLSGVLKVSGIASLIIFPIVVSFWSRTGNPTFYDLLGLSSTMKLIICYVYKYTVPVLGILAVYVFFDWLIQYKFLFKKH